MKFEYLLANITRGYYQFADNVSNAISAIKYFFSNKERVMQDSWSLDHSLAVWILPRLEYLRCNKNSYSAQVLEDEELLKDAIADGFVATGIEDMDTLALYNYALDRMIHSFMFVLSDDYWMARPDDVTTIRHKRGLEIFSKYFSSLWD